MSSFLYFFEIFNMERLSISDSSYPEKLISIVQGLIIVFSGNILHITNSVYEIIPVKSTLDLKYSNVLPSSLIQTVK